MSYISPIAFPTAEDRASSYSEPSKDWLDCFGEALDIVIGYVEDYYMSSGDSGLDPAMEESYYYE